MGQKITKYLFVLEDASISTDYIVESVIEALEEYDILLEVIEATNISEADSKMNKYYQKINCVLCDSNMEPRGLASNELIELSDEGLYAGLLWLRGVVEKKLIDLNNIIMYTAYCDEIINFIRNDEENIFCKDKDFLKSFIITKESPDDFENNELVERIIAIITRDGLK